MISNTRHIQDLYAWINSLLIILALTKTRLHIKAERIVHHSTLMTMYRIVHAPTTQLPVYQYPLNRTLPSCTYEYKIYTLCHHCIMLYTNYTSINLLASHAFFAKSSKISKSPLFSHIPLNDPSSLLMSSQGCAYSTTSPLSRTSTLS